jgi:hypothetical protein
VACIFLGFRENIDSGGAESDKRVEWLQEVCGSVKAIGQLSSLGLRHHHFRGEEQSTDEQLENTRK